MFLFQPYKPKFAVVIIREFNLVNEYQLTKKTTVFVPMVDKESQSTTNKWTKIYIPTRTSTVHIVSTAIADCIIAGNPNRIDGAQGYRTSNSGRKSCFMLYLGETREDG